MIRLCQNTQPIAGTIDRVTIRQASRASRERYSVMVLHGVTDSEGSFDLTVDEAIGWARLARLAGRAGDTLPDGASATFTGIFDPANYEPPVLAALTVSGNAGSTDNADESIGAVNPLVCGPLRIAVSGGGAGRRFSLVMLFSEGS